MEPSDLRIALFSGNYNYVRDGANQALNRLVGYLLRQGVQVRVYAPTVKDPAFPPTGDLVSIPAIPIPGREEYRLPIGLPSRVRRDLKKFNPNVVHVASPDIVAHRLVTWARRNRIAAVVVLMPPAVPPGLPPMNMEIIMMSNVAGRNESKGIELKPAVLRVTD